MRVFTAQSASMAPTVEVGDTVEVDTSAPCCQRGEIVVFRTRPNELWRRTGVATLIKRVVAVPGDTIAPCDAERVCVNGRALPERYLRKGTVTVFPTSLPDVSDADGQQVPACEPSSPSGACTVPAGMLFVLGDNRPISDDSRALGPITAGSVVGRVVHVR